MLSMSSDEDEPQRGITLFNDASVPPPLSSDPGELALPPSNQQALRGTANLSQASSSSESSDLYTHSARPVDSRRDNTAGIVTIVLSGVGSDTTGLASTPLRSATYSYQCRAASSVKSLSMMFRVLEEMHCALHAGRFVTKRDIYYRAPALFGSQAAVDRLVDDIAGQIGVRRSALGVTAASKGLAAGDATIGLIQTGSTLSEVTMTLSHQQETLIPSVDDIAEVRTASSWLLVVEKEAVFQTLMEAGITSGRTRDLGPGLLVTGKGYPDLITREFLARTSQDCPL